MYSHRLRSVNRDERMTIIIVSYTAQEIVLVSDSFKYVLKDGVLEDVLGHKLEITHANLNEHVERIERDSFKIHPLTRNMAVCCSGDSSFGDIIQHLNVREDIPKQILARLENKKLTVFWTCHVARFNEKTGKAELTSIVYDRGTIKTKEHAQDNISLDSFAPETAELFFKKYAMVFYVGNTEEKTKVVQEFFEEITEIFQGNAGGIPTIAKIDKNGFHWVSTPKLLPIQNFTNYSSTWCPEKIETSASSDWAIVNDNWQTILKLENFECDSTMLLFILAHAGEVRCSNDGVKARCYLSIDATSDDDQYESGLLTETRGYMGCDGHPSNNHYSVHSVKVLAKGLHTLRLHAKRYVATSGNVIFVGRRLTILKGFYQGGTT